MLKNYFINHRITSRNQINSQGKLLFNYKSKKIELTENIYINSISLRGLQIVFANDDLLFYLINQNRRHEYDLRIELAQFGQIYGFKCHVHWIRIFNIGEKNYYVLCGLIFDPSHYNEIKNDLIDLLASLHMKHSFQS